MSAAAATLWIGDLEPAMDEYFVKQAFTIMGENPLNIKIIRNKMTGLSRGYGFLEFDDEETAQRALLQCNGKPMPNAAQPKMFRLNHANNGGGSNGTTRNGNGGRFGNPDEFSMFVGDLSAEVNDMLLYHAFSSRYPSVKAAKVVLDQNGMSKGFGFVRFGTEGEYQGALVEMQNSLVVGSKPIRVGVATPRNTTQRRDNFDQQYSYSDQRVPRDQYSGGAERRRVFYRNPSYE